MKKIVDLGKIGITLAGEYDDNVTYEKLTIVLRNGKSYISKTENKGVLPETDTTQKTWQLVAEAKSAYQMLVDAGKTTLTEEEFLEQLVDATKGRHLIQGNLINAADEEDLTTEHSNLLGIDALKLANRDNINGMGYIILRKNKSFAEQVTKENTIYEIRYNFEITDLIQLPSSCILSFNGGGLYGNGTLQGDLTLLTGFPKIFCNGAGTYANEFINVRWFGAKGDNSDDTDAFNRALSFIDTLTGQFQEQMQRVSTLYIPNGTYKVNRIKVQNISILGESSTNTIIRPIDNDNTYVFEVVQTTSYGPKVTISNLYILGIILNKRTSVQYLDCFFGGNGGIEIIQSSDILIHNIIFDMASKAVSIKQSTSITITDCQFFANAVYAIKIISGINIIIANNNFNIYGPPVQIEAGDNITINNNTFKSDSDIYYGDPYIISFKDTETDYVKGLVIISNNNFNDARSRYQGINITTKFSNIIIQNNVFRKLTKAIWSSAVGDALIIDANKFISSLQENIFCVNAKNIITNNYFEGGIEGTGASYKASIFIQSKDSIVKNNIQRFLKNSDGKYVNNFSYWLMTNETGKILIEDNKIFPFDIASAYVDDIRIETPALFYIKNSAKSQNYTGFNFPVLTKLDAGTHHSYNGDIYIWGGDSWLLADGNQRNICEYLSLSALQKSNLTIKCNKVLDLNGETISLGSNLTLDFSGGGKIINGGIVLSQTKILPQSLVVEDYITANISGTYKIGQCVFDSSLGKPKWWNGTKWVDSMGTDINNL